MHISSGSINDDGEVRMKEIVGFFIRNREFGVDVSRMRTIENEKPVIKRENMPGFVLGIVDIHGEQIPLVDISQMLNLPKAAPGTEKKMVVFTTPKGDFAIPCEDISEITMVENQDIQPFPNIFDKDKTAYMDCIVRKKKNVLVLVIAPERLMTEEQWRQFQVLLDEIEKERIEEERRRQEEAKRRKEEEKRKREEEIARMQAGESDDAGAGRQKDLEEREEDKDE